MTETATLIFYNEKPGAALYPLNLPFSIKAIVHRLNKARKEALSDPCGDHEICAPKSFGTALHAVYLPDGRAWDVTNGFRKYGDPDYYKQVYDLLAQSHLQETYEDLEKE